MFGLSYLAGVDFVGSFERETVVNLPALVSLLYCGPRGYGALKVYYYPFEEGVGFT